MRFNAVHFSGHGHPQCLTFEDGRGGLQPVPPRRLEALVRPRPPALAVVCACHSLRAAQALVAAGVKHVVAVSLDEPLLDAAAVAFTRAFYHALSVGDSVRRAFDGGVKRWPRRLEWVLTGRRNLNYYQKTATTRPKYYLVHS